MSKDSLNGTVTVTNFHDELPLPTKEVLYTDPKPQEASIEIQRWDQENNTRTNERNSQRQHQDYERNSRPPSVASSTSKQPRISIRSPRVKHSN